MNAGAWHDDSQNHDNDREPLTHPMLAPTLAFDFHGFRPVR